MTALTDPGVRQILSERVGHRVRYRAVINQHVEPDRLVRLRQAAPAIEVLAAHSLDHAFVAPPGTGEITLSVELYQTYQPGMQSRISWNVAELHDGIDEVSWKISAFS